MDKSLIWMRHLNISGHKNSSVIQMKFFYVEKEARVRADVKRLKSYIAGLEKKAEEERKK